MRQLPLTWSTFLVVASLLETACCGTAMPDPVKDSDVVTCRKEVQSLKDQKTTCENDIRAASQKTDGEVEGMKRYFADIKAKEDALKPDLKNLRNSLKTKYQKESDLYKKLTTEVKKVTTAVSFFEDSAERKQAATVSKTLPLSQDILVDSWMACDDDRTSAARELKGCKTKAKTVAMWNSQRQKLYKDKADVYIMRVSRMADPVNAQFKESARVDATISRLERQIIEVKQATIYPYDLVGNNKECSESQTGQRLKLKESAVTVDQCHDMAKKDGRCGKFFEVGSNVCMCYTGTCTNRFDDPGEDLYQMKT